MHKHLRTIYLFVLCLVTNALPLQASCESTTLSEQQPLVAKRSQRKGKKIGSRRIKKLCQTFFFNWSVAAQSNGERLLLHFLIAPRSLATRAQLQELAEDLLNLEKSLSIGLGHFSVPSTLHPHIKDHFSRALKGLLYGLKKEALTLLISDVAKKFIFQLDANLSATSKPLESFAQYCDLMHQCLNHLGTVNLWPLAFTHGVIIYCFSKQHQGFLEEKAPLELCEVLSARIAALNGHKSL